MGAMASIITSLTIVYLRAYSGADQRKHQSSASPVTGEFPAQMASNAENVSIWWRHHDTPLKYSYAVWWYPLIFLYNYIKRITQHLKDDCLVSKALISGMTWTSIHCSEVFLLTFYVQHSGCIVHAIIPKPKLQYYTRVLHASWINATHSYFFQVRLRETTVDIPEVYFKDIDWPNQQLF